MDYLFETAISNSIFAGLLAMVAVVVGAKANRPQLAYLLWILVFLKLVTPPIINVPVSLATTKTSDPENAVLSEPESSPALLITDNSSDEHANGSSRFAEFYESIATIQPFIKPVLLLFWLTGCLVILVTGLIRVAKFNRLLWQRSSMPPKQIVSVVAGLSKRMRVPGIPKIMMVDAKVSPMIWWTGGRVRMIVPNWLIQQLPEHQWKHVIAHELAHVERKDYLIRWLEWSVCTFLWWNPIAWWAQRNLRSIEEICCDALVLSRLNPRPQVYAHSILQAVESLVCPEFRPPAIASQINSGGFLERRFEMILSNSVNVKRSLFLPFAMLLSFLLMVPLGLVRAQDMEKVENKLEKMIEKGQLEREHAEVMLEALANWVEREHSDKDEQKRRKHDGDAERHHRDNIWTDRDDRKALMHRIEIGVHEGANKIESAIKAGKITAKEGRRKLIELREGAHQKIRKIEEDLHRSREGNEWQEKRKERDRMVELMVQLESDVANGKISRDDAAKKIVHLKKRTHDENAIRKLEDAVREGMLRKEDAEKEIIALRQKMAAPHRHDSGSKNRDDELKRIGLRLRLAVANGDLTEQQAKAKFEAIQKERDHRSNSKDQQLDKLLRVAAEKLGDLSLYEDAHKKISDGDVSKTEMIHHLELLLRDTSENEKRKQALLRELHEVELQAKREREDRKRSIEAVREKLSGHSHDDEPHSHNEDDDDDDR